MNQRTLSQDISKALARGESVAMATVIRVRGSAPRGPGARMLVFQDGTSKGSVSGGCLEAEAYARAQEAMRTGVPQRFEYDLTKDVGESEGMVCGGKVEVLVEAFRPA